MKVLVTGAGGFVGRALCQELLNQGYDVVGTVRRLRGDAGFPCLLVEDIGPETQWNNLLSGVDVVIHLAARVHVMKDRAESPLDAFRYVNSLGTEQLASSAARAGVKRFIYISSIKVNGEGGDNVLTEADQPDPKEPYALSKWEAEKRLKEVSLASGMGVVVIRPPLVYGPGVRANFLSLIRWVDRAVPLPLGGVRNRRSLVFVGNLTDLIVRCIDHPDAVGEVFMVSDGDDVSTPELLRRVAQVMGRRARLVNIPPNILRFIFKLVGKGALIERLCDSLSIDISKTKQTLGWTPPFSLDHGLSEVTQWYLQEKERRDV